jgi:hypothetical protein
VVRILALLAGLLVGCLFFRAAMSSENPALPRYTPGDNFTYSDGRTETVISVSGEVVRWRDDLGFIFSQFRNPMLPRLSWERGGRRGESTVDVLPDLLWPLSAEATGEFVARRSVIEANGVRHDFVQRWRCHVTAPTPLKVPAGSFDAWLLVCDRRDELGQLREERSWWYAPTVGHVVAFEQLRDGVRSRRELIAWRRFDPGSEPAADPGVAVFQQALESVLSGQELSWKSADGRRQVAVAPIRTFQRDVLYCRDYRLTSTQAGNVTVQNGTACRGPDAVWRRMVEPKTE